MASPSPAILIYLFFFRLLWGWNLALLFVSRAESTEDFLRVSLRFSLGFAAVSAFAALASGISLRELFPLIFLVLGLLLYLSRSNFLLRVVGIILVSAPPFVTANYSVLSKVNFILAALALGSVFMGQFLGHWYLNVPNIHIREFKRIARWALIFLVLRTFWVLGQILLNPPGRGGLSSGEFFGVSGDTWRGLGAFGVIIFTARVLFGLFAPLILTWMAKKTVDMRSTQSATGIFYANSVLMVLGELCALYLETELKWPI